MSSPYCSHVSNRMGIHVQSFLRLFANSEIDVVLALPPHSLLAIKINRIIDKPMRPRLFAGRRCAPCSWLVTIVDSGAIMALADARLGSREAVTGYL